MNSANGHNGHGAGVTIRLHRISKGASYTLFTLSPEPYGLITHFQAGRKGVGRSQLCYAECPPALHRLPVIWKGYIAALLLVEQPTPIWLPIVQEVTANAELDLRAKYGPQQFWRFTRTKATERKKEPPVEARLALPCCDAPKYPLWDVRAVLCHVYGVPELPASVPNPMPARIAAEPMAATGFQKKPDGEGLSAEERLKVKEVQDEWRKRHQGG